MFRAVSNVHQICDSNWLIFLSGKKKLENSNFHARHRRIFSDRSENFDEWKSSLRVRINVRYIKANLHAATFERAAVSDRQRLSVIQSPCSKSLGAHYFK